MRDGNGAKLLGRVVLALLTFYALALIVPDFIRLVRPLGSFGLASNNDGLIYDVQSPFAANEASPAWRAGVRPGDQLDLMGMRCIPADTSACASMLALWGGLNYVTPGRSGTLLLVAGADRPAREVKLVAESRPPNRLVKLVLLLDQVAGVLCVLGAAWLVWIRPGGMTWGFFAYMIQFNPGQAYQFYAWLQEWPPALLAQDIATCALQAAGYTGFLLFALRAPTDRAEGRWRAIERALPVVAILLLLLSFASLGSAFGYPTESVMRATILIGFTVDVAALGILIGRRADLAPRDYQRLRWVIWGCLIGLPAFLVAELAQVTSLPISILGADAVTEDVTGLLYLVNGILCLFVVEAVRRPTVINVSIPLRRATVLGLLLSVPAFFLHKEIDVVDEVVRLPNWAWVLVASFLAFLVSRVHETATDLIDRLLDRKLRRAERLLTAVGERIQRADALAEIERLLVEEPAASLRLASAALFRQQDGGFRRHVSAGWDAVDADVLTGADPLLASRSNTEPFPLDASDPTDLDDPSLPGGVARPILAVPVGNPRRCFAVVLYGGHEAGTDLESKERDLLESLARDAEIAYAQVESETLRKQILVLEHELARTSEPR